MDSPLVSVIIPVYNGERFLAEAIDSVLAQTYRSFELIVADDGSTDRSREIALSYATVRYVHQANLGTGPARNLGVRHARGKFLAFLDQDDLWMRDKLALQIAAFQADPSLEVASGLVEQFVDGGADERYVIPSAPQPGYLTCAILIKREAFDAIGCFQEDSLTADIGWFALLIDTTRGLLILPHVVARRRIHGGNASILDEERKTQSILRALRTSIERKRANPPPKSRS